MQDILALSAEQQMIRDTVRDFTEREIKPRARQMDEAGEFPLEIVRKMAPLGLLGIPVPEEYGGAGADTLSYAVAVEEIARACGSTALTLAAHTSLGTLPIFYSGTEEQKRKFVPRLARGEWIGAYGLTEPNAGSDASATQTRAVRKGDFYLVNGSKSFCTNASVAQSFVFTATLDPSRGPKGITAFLAERGTAGFSIGKREDKLGMRASDTCQLVFEDCKIPVENRLSGEGEGFAIFMRTLDSGRITIASLALGLAEGAFERAVGYAKQRRQFDQPIASFQAIQWMIADTATEIEAARLMIYRAAHLRDAGLPHGREAAMAKLYASEMATRATNRAIQIFGGNGFMKEFEVERFYRDAKLCEIGEGTSEIQRIVIARHVLGKIADRETP